MRSHDDDSGGDGGGPALVLVEAEGIQDWIIGGSTELRVIRGGSLQLDDAFLGAEAALGRTFGAPSPPHEAAAGPESGAWWLPVRSSGTMTAVFPDRRPAEQAATLLGRTLSDALPRMTIRVGVGAWPSGDPDGLESARRSAMQAATAATRGVRSGYVPGTMLCSSCGVASGQAEPFSPGRHAEAPWHLCTNCHDRAKRAVDDTDPVEGTRLELDMARIGAAWPHGRWAGYVAIVSADGNAIGQRFARIHDAAELRRESVALKRTIDRAQRAALTAAAEDHRALVESETSRVPVNRVMQAGDDVRMVVPAHVGLTAAAALVTSEPTLQGCAGVVVTAPTVPFSDAHAQAELLLGEAKRVARRVDPANPPSRLAFAVETGARPPSDPSRNRLSASPYDAEAIGLLQATATALTVSSHAIRRVADSLLQGGRVAEREWRLFRHRCTSDDRQHLGALWRVLGADPSEPWVQTGLGAASPIGDLLLLRSLRQRSRR